MNNVSIRVQKLAKLYHIGQRESYKVLRDVLADAMSAPFRAAASMFDRQRDTQRSIDDHIWALKEVSFEVGQGEVIGIIGPNGAGKTTLLKILSRITEPTEGQVEIRGRVGSLLEVGTGFHPELTGRENIYLNGAILGMKKAEIERKFDEIVDFSGVERFIDTPVKRYSSGMYVRLAFAVAAHLEPQILLVDEVLAVGDASFQKKCLGKMRDVAGEGRTVLFVSHDMSAIMRLCPRAILLENGGLARDGLATDVVTAYMKDVSEDGGSRSWSLATAPGSDEVRLVSVALTKDDGTSVSTVSVEDELRLRIGYYVGHPGLGLRCAALFFTQGVCAFASLEPLESERAQAGVYYSTVAIPPNLLAEGEYSVGVSIFSSKVVKSNYITARDLMMFQVTDPISGQSARGDYTGGFAGVVRPLLHWEMRFDGDSLKDDILAEDRNLTG